MDPREALHPTMINAALIGTRFGGKLQHVASIGSTSTALIQAAAAGAPEGTGMVADEQTAGRGRGGHSWHSAPGAGLYVSVLAKPSLPFDRALWISLATGLAAQAAIRDTADLHADIRWPNDLLLDGKKCGGILVEASVEPSAASDTPGTGTSPIRHAVIGIGINVNHGGFPSELAQLATSLRLSRGEPQNRQALLISLLRHLDRELTSLEESGADAHPDESAGLLQRFARASSWVGGRRVYVPELGGYTGVTAGLDARGFLLVDADDGTRRTVISGGVREFD